jgi:hypothetical protein
VSIRNRNLVTLRFARPVKEMNTISRSIMFPGRRARLVRKADNLTAICELSIQYGILNISQPYRPLWPITGDISTFLDQCEQLLH